MKKLLFTLITLVLIPLAITSQDLNNIEFISPFNDGLSAIKKDNKWAFINKDGEQVIDYRDDIVITIFGDDSYPIFNSGRCLIMKKKEGVSYFGYIDKTGTTIIKPQYLNATNFNNGLAIILELHKNILGSNDLLDKNMVNYSYTESMINANGDIVNYISEKPTHITLSKDTIRNPPEIKSKFISERLIAIKSDNNHWLIKKI
jgi:hypothetical protein